jgi:hypothetical protein
VLDDHDGEMLMLMMMMMHHSIQHQVNELRPHLGDGRRDQFPQKDTPARPRKDAQPCHGIHTKKEWITSTDVSGADAELISQVG